MPELRTERTYGVTNRLTPGQRARLAELVNSDGYPVMLDVWEQTLIEMESELINTPVGERTTILARHQKVQAGWQLFEHMQRKIIDSAAEHVRETAPEVPPVDRENADILQVTEPFNRYSDQATPEPEE